ncbi:hypothetical protein LIER_26730 [Lithospermum erythrorhizon]|uniref:Uncharacterized protein n=1 Tax=Lithospermum erythrorhizon TaxID=34254 RepID=A0AAV3R9F1_LITER
MDHQGWLPRNISGGGYLKAQPLEFPLHSGHLGTSFGQFPTKSKVRCLGARGQPSDPLHFPLVEEEGCYKQPALGCLWGQESHERLVGAGGGEDEGDAVLTPPAYLTPLRAGEG